MPFMLGNILKNLVSGPATRPYPVTQRNPFPGTRGEIVFHEDRCCYCGMCARGCPAEAISIQGSRKSGDITLGYNPFSCIYCGKCAEMCPCCAVEILGPHAKPAYSKATLFRESEPV